MQPNRVLTEEDPLLPPGLRRTQVQNEDTEDPQSTCTVRADPAPPTPRADHTVSRVQSRPGSAQSTSNPDSAEPEPPEPRTPDNDQDLSSRARSCRDSPAEERACGAAVMQPAALSPTDPLRVFTCTQSSQHQCSRQPGEQHIPSSRRRSPLRRQVESCCAPDPPPTFKDEF